MTRITNIHGLPASIVRAIENDPYTGGGDISVTKLIDAPQIRALYAQHGTEITADASERVWSLLGQAVHTILERAGTGETDAVVEERLYAEVNGWQVSGQFDRLHITSGTLSDYKVTTIYKAGGSDGWTRQLNVLRWLAHKNGYTVNTLQIIGIFRDWRKTDAMTKLGYPPTAIGVIPVPLWPLDEAEEYVRERVAIHQAAAAGEIPPCTDEERWYSGTTYALKKHGAKRALRVAADVALLGEPPEGHSIETREGVYRRCTLYCDVRPFCAQAQSLSPSTLADDDTQTDA